MEPLDGYEIRVAIKDRKRFYLARKPGADAWLPLNLWARPHEFGYRVSASQNLNEGPWALWETDSVMLLIDNWCFFTNYWHFYAFQCLRTQNVDGKKL